MARTKKAPEKTEAEKKAERLAGARQMAAECPATRVLEYAARAADRHRLGMSNLAAELTAGAASAALAGARQAATYSLEAICMVETLALLWSEVAGEMEAARKDRSIEGLSGLPVQEVREALEKVRGAAERKLLRNHFAPTSTSAFANACTLAQARGFSAFLEDAESCGTYLRFISEARLEVAAAEAARPMPCEDCGEEAAAIGLRLCEDCRDARRAERTA